MREKRVREEERKRVEERLRRKGWTGSACRSKTIFGARLGFCMKRAGSDIYKN